MLISIILAAIIAASLFALWGTSTYENGDKISKSVIITGTIVPAAILGLMDIFRSKFIWLTIIFIMVAVIIAIALALLSENADKGWEIILFFVVEIVIFHILARLCNAIITMAQIESPVGLAWLKYLPWAVFIIALGVTITLLVVKKKETMSFIPIITMIAALVITFLVMVVPAFAKSNESSTEEKVTPAVVEKATATQEESNVSWYGFYNPSLQYDTDASNDFNFGYNPYDASKLADFYDKDLRERIIVDPALGAAEMAWIDANLGTNYLGEEYEANDRDWSKAINAAKRKFMANQESYYAKITAFFAFLDSAKISLENSNQELSDQMYMNPYTEDKVPEVVVYETTDHVGWQLVYTFTIKENKIQVAFRIECGYQPTNVAEIMNITPQQKGGGGSDPTPVIPTPDPTPIPEYNKDKTQGTQGDLVAPNDNPGPGEDTNNGVGATESTKDQPDNSNHITYEEYVEKIEELEEINETQQTGDGGTGSIDQPTKIIPPAHTTDDKEIDTVPAGAWGGPAD